jgi:hypothetical protein
VHSQDHVKRKFFAVTSPSRRGATIRRALDIPDTAVV